MARRQAWAKPLWGRLSPWARPAQKSVGKPSEKLTRNVVICGAGSSIARAFARVRAERWDRVILAGRDLDQLARLAADLRIRHEIDVHTLAFDATDFASHDQFIADVRDACRGPIDDLFLFQGLRLEQDDLTPDIAGMVDVQRMLEVNLTSVISIATLALPHLRTQGGTIAALTSPGMSRPAPQRAAYAASQKALDTYLASLMQQQAPRGIRVLNLKPGDVDTHMTWGRTYAHKPLSPQDVAVAIHTAWTRERQGMVYIPGRLRMWGRQALMHLPRRAA